MQGGIFGKQISLNNCVSGNTLTAATFPAEIEGTWGCQNSTTPNPNNGLAAIGYLVQLSSESEARTSVPQAAPPAAEDDAEPLRRGADQPALPVESRAAAT